MQCRTHAHTQSHTYREGQRRQSRVTIEITQAMTMITIRIPRKFVSRIETFRVHDRTLWEAGALLNPLAGAPRIYI